jgi:hypothetical protein
MALTNSVSNIIPVIRYFVKDQLTSDGDELFEYVGDSEFPLSESFAVATSIQVYKNGTLVDTQDWSYNADTNIVTVSFITSGQSFVDDDLIRITYNYYKKYSDTEIQGYLESSLAYFPQYKYKKVFYINSQDEVVAENDLDPTLSELYFICIIASILIDPQNIIVNTPEFKLTANRSASDQEQISEAFCQFQRFTGTVSFNPTYYTDDLYWR